MRLLLLALKRERMFDQESERETGPEAGEDVRPRKGEREREPKRERESEGEREREKEERKTQSEEDGEEEAVHEALQESFTSFAGNIALVFSSIVFLLIRHAGSSSPFNSVRTAGGRVLFDFRIF